MMLSPDPMAGGLDRETRVVAMARALNASRGAILGDPLSRLAAYTRFEISGYTRSDEADAIERAKLWRQRIANSERSLSGRNVS